MIIRRTVTPTITAGAYTALDVIGGTLTFTNAEGTLNSVLISDAANQAVSYYLYLFHSVPTNIVDNAAFDPVDADIKNIIHRVYLDSGDAYVLNDNRVNLKEYSLENRRNLRSGERSGNLYGFLVPVTAPTYAATTDISVVLEVEV